MSTMVTRTDYRRSPAFTLVELLVVLGIMAIVIALLLPALVKVRRQALEVVCASNLRQLGIALTFYTTETGYFPGCHSFSGIHDDRTFAIWPTRLRWALGARPTAPGSTGFETLFWCPANDAATQWRITYGNGTHYATDRDGGFGYVVGERVLQIEQVSFSYGYNDWGVGPDITQNLGLGGDVKAPARPDGYGRELRASRVRRPSEMIAIGDSTADQSWDFNLDPSEPAQYPGKVHREGANILFCDGHVQWLSQRQLLNIDKGDPEGSRMNRMWNNDNEPH